MGFCLIPTLLFPSLTVPAGLVMVFVLAPLIASVFLINRPRAIVPPAFRAEEGVVTEYFAKPS